MMQDVFTHKNLSFASTKPPTISSLSTASTETAHGIGSVSGRMIYAIGAAALRGVELLAIRRKLKEVHEFFPHQNDTTLDDFETIYDDVLELSRHGIYKSQIRKPALQALLVQIATRNTHFLVQSLLKWPPVEIALFLSDIIACMPSEWLPPHTDCGSMQQELSKIFISHIQREEWAAAPLFDFVMELTRANDSACQAVVTSGFLDMLLCMQASDFAQSVDTCQAHGVEDARARTIEVLGSLCQWGNTQIMASSHCACILWPEMNIIMSMFWEITSDRPPEWMQLGPDIRPRPQDSLRNILTPSSMKDISCCRLSYLDSEHPSRLSGAHRLVYRFCDAQVADETFVLKRTLFYSPCLSLFD